MTNHTAEEIIAAYQKTGSIWRAGRLLGLSGQSVWDRLKRLGVPLANEKWSDEDLVELRILAETCSISDIANRLGRPYAGVALKLSRLGIPVRRKARKHSPQGKHEPIISAAAAHQLVQELTEYQGSIKRFCLQRGVSVEIFVQSIQKHAPEFWTAYTFVHSELEQQACTQCQKEFYPMHKKQLACSRRCSALMRSDSRYFSGRRTEAIGMREATCQLCQRVCASKLAAHHLVGKENDPHNRLLIALCNGCHNIVGMLAGREGCVDPEFWERLIHLVLMRSQGAEPEQGNEVCVEITRMSDEDIHEFLEDEDSVPVIQ